LIQEEALIRANATEDELKQSKDLAELSPTARFLKEFEEKKLALQEEKKLREQELVDYERQFEEQTQIYENFVQAKEILEERYQQKIEAIEKSITDTIFKENQKRIESLRALELQAIATARALQSA
jgi:hypothetical protein